MEAEDSSSSDNTTATADICLERTWFNNELVGDELDLCPRAANATDEDDFNTFYFYQVSRSVVISLNYPLAAAITTPTPILLSLSLSLFILPFLLFLAQKILFSYCASEWVCGLCLYICNPVGISSHLARGLSRQRKRTVDVLFSSLADCFEGARRRCARKGPRRRSRDVLCWAGLDWTGLGWAELSSTTAAELYQRPTIKASTLAFLFLLGKSRVPLSK